MHMRWWWPLATLLLLAGGCAADAGGKSAGDARIAQSLVRVFEARDPRAAAAARGIETSAHGVRVDVQTQGLASEHRGRFDVPGVHVHHFSARSERVAVSVANLAALRALLRIDPVRRLAPAYGSARDDIGGGT